MRELWIAGVLAGVGSSCGFITAGAASAAASSSSASNAPAAITGFAVESAKAEPAHIRFTLADAESDQVEVELLYDAPDPDGSEPLEAVQGARLEHVHPLGGGPTLANPLVLDASPQGKEHTFEWLFTQEKSVLDAGEWTPDVLVYARITGGVQALTPGANAARLGLGNDPPVIVDADQDGFADADLPSGEVVGLVRVTFLVSDSSFDQVDVQVEYALADGLDVDAGELPQEGDWELATPDGQAPTAIQTVDGGTSVDFLWNPIADLGLTEHDIVFRITPDDRTQDDLGNPMGVGAPALTRAFRVDNNATPIVQLDSGSLLANPDERRGIPVPYRVIDAESDLVEVIFQWRGTDEAFPELPTDNAALDAILSDPLLRRQHHVCTAYPRHARGRAIPVDAISLRLPELAQRESWRLAAGIEGSPLELLRPWTIPVPITPTWTANPLSGPTGALALGDGITAAVLDSGGPGSWRLREIELSTGAVVRELASSVGSPSALAFERGERSALVALDLSGSWSIARVDLASGAIEALFTSDSSLPSGPVRGLASLGLHAALATVGDALLRLDWSDPLAPRAAVVLDGLATPWGIALDPLNEGKVYLAERDAPTALGTGRVLAVDLDARAALPVVVRTEDLQLGSLERPEELVHERRVARLLVATHEAGGNRLVSLDLGGKDANQAFALGPVHTSEIASIASGPDGWLVACVPSLGELLVGGGVEQRRTVSGYQVSTQRAVADAAFAPEPRAGQTWRLPPPKRVLANPAGVGHTFVWDASAEIGHGSAFLRAFARDAEAGISAQGSASKRVRAAWDVPPLELGVAFPDSVAAADLDGDGDLDLVSSRGLTDILTVFFQSAPGSFDPLPLELGGPTLTDFPASVAAADLDGDGDQDLVSANATGSNLSIFFQSAPGSFDPAPLEVGGPVTTPSPVSVAAADLDGDGDQDLVCANFDDTLRIFFQSAPGSFAIGKKLVGPTVTSGDRGSVAAADLDGDGDLDLVSANVLGGTLTAFFRAPGTFDPTPLVIPNGNPFAGPNSVVAADLDGDGDEDLVSTLDSPFGVGGALTIFFQTAPGSFDPSPLVLESEAATRVAAADVDGDGDLDLVSTGGSGSQPVVRIFFQRAPGSFDPSPPLLQGVGPGLTLATADLDGDGHLDLVSLSSTGNLAVFFQSARGSFDPAPLVLGSLQSNAGVTSVVVADLDEDGDLDLVGANPWNNTLPMFFQGPPGTFDPTSIEFGAPAEPNSVAAADLDGDGDQDLASANYIRDTLSVFLQSAAGSFEPTPLELGGSPITDGPVSVAAADVDGDGDLELVSANYDSDNLTVFFQSAPGSFDPAPLEVGGPVTTPGPLSVAAADLDGDGDLDLVSASSDNSTLAIFFQSAPGSFDPAPLEVGGPVTTPGPFSVAAADLDGDGDQDLVCTNSGGKDLTIFFQDAPASFDPDPLALAVPSGSQPSRVAAADVDGDGDLDLVSANFFSNALTVFLQTAPGRFDPLPLELEGFPDGAVSVAVADVDGDGDPDLVSGTIDSQFAIFFGSH